MRIKHENVELECVKGDIAAQHDAVAVVNAANAQLRIGGGVAGTIHRAAGPGLEEECRPFAPIRPGKAVITGGHELPNRYVIHCLGPVYGVDRPEADLLAQCYRNALRLAEENEIDSVALPALSTGAFGYPMEAAAAPTPSPSRLVIRPPAPQVGDPLNYATLIYRMCEAYSDRWT